MFSTGGTREITTVKTLAPKVRLDSGKRHSGCDWRLQKSIRRYRRGTKFDSRVSREGKKLRLRSLSSFPLRVFVRTGELTEHKESSITADGRLDCRHSRFLLWRDFLFRLAAPQPTSCFSSTLQFTGCYPSIVSLLWRFSGTKLCFIESCFILMLCYWNYTLLHLHTLLLERVSGFAEVVCFHFSVQGPVDGSILKHYACEYMLTCLFVDRANFLYVGTF